MNRLNQRKQNLTFENRFEMEIERNKNIISKNNSNIKQKKFESEKNEIEGDFDEGDKVKKIIKEKLDKDGKLLLEIQWEKRQDGNIPKNSFILSNLVKKNAPLLVAEYLEQRLIEMECITMIESKPIKPKEKQNLDSSIEDNSFEDNAHIRKKNQIKQKRGDSIVSLDSEYADDSP